MKLWSNEALNDGYFLSRFYYKKQALEIWIIFIIKLLKPEVIILIKNLKVEV